MVKIIDSNKYYDILDEQFLCCGKFQFRHICKKDGNKQECYFCTFNPDEPCEC